MADERARKAEEKREAAALAGTGLEVKRERRPEAEPLIEQFAAPIVSREHAKLALKFTAMDAAQVAAQMRATGGGYPWPETREGLIQFAREHGRRYFEREGKWPSAQSGQIGGLETTWAAINSALRARWGLSLREVFGRAPHGDAYEKNARAISAFFDKHGQWPRTTASNAEERRLGVALSHLRQNRHDLLDRYEIPRTCDRSATIRAALGKTQWVSIAVIIPRVCKQPDANQSTADVGGESGKILDTALRCAADPTKCGKSRGLGTSSMALAVLCQVNSIARMKAEIRADCWRLWLDGADKPDTRLWVDILAAGDNKLVERAERVAFLDWTDPGPDGKPTRKPWPQAQHPDLLATAKTSRPKAGNRAAKAQNSKERT